MRKGLLALLPLAAMLSACWSSTGELISYDAAETPSVAGTYVFTATGAAPKTVRIDPAVGRYYAMHSTNSEGAATTDQLRFDQLSSKWYLIHSYGGGEAGAENYYYRILRVNGRTIDEFDPGCDASDTKFSGVTEDAGDCTFTDYEGLRDAALVRLARYETGETDAMSLTGTYTR